MKILGSTLVFVAFPIYTSGVAMANVFGLMFALAGVLILSNFDFFEVHVNIPAQYAGLPKVAIVGKYHVYSRSGVYTNLATGGVLLNDGTVIKENGKVSRSDGPVAVLNSKGKEVFPNYEA